MKNLAKLSNLAKLVVSGLVGLSLFGAIAEAKDFDQASARVKLYSRNGDCMMSDANEAQRVIQENHAGKRLFVASGFFGQNNDIVTIFSNDPVPTPNVKNVVYYFNSNMACEMFKINYDYIVSRLQRAR